jgi:D-alanyl-lipoteichoic acid acyltransferase DltB (MBOAT superfamily)
LYIPLGGNRVSFARNCINILIVFLLSGLWHGANWTFVAWGAIHGLYITIHILADKYMWKKNNYGKNKWGKLIHIVITFNMIAFAWIFFRAESLSKAIAIIKGVFSLHNLNEPDYSVPDFGLPSVCISIIMIVAMMVFEYFTSYELKEIENKQIARISFASLSLILIIALGVFNGQSFIYFQF